MNRFLILMLITSASCQSKPDNEPPEISAMEKCNQATWKKGGKYQGLKLIESPYPHDGGTFEISLLSDGTKYISDRWMVNDKGDTTRVLCFCDSGLQVIKLKEVSTNERGFTP